MALGDPTLADVFLAIKKIREETPDLAWMLDYPAVAKLLIQRAAGEIDDQKFRFELYKTKFWKDTSDAQRQWRTLTSIDPAKARRQRQELTLRVRQLMGELGVNLQGAKIRAKGEPKQGYDLIGRDKAAKIADLALYNGWNEDQITRYLLSLASFGQEGRTPAGGLAVAMTQMRRLEEAYGVQSRDRQRFARARKMMGGTLDVEAYEEQLRQRALARYGGNDELVGVLERGGTLEDWFDDYRRMISEELEIPGEEVSILSPRWQQILNHRGEDGRVRPMTFDEARRHIRTRAEWNPETNSRAAEMEAGMAKNLLQVFGKVAA